MNEKNRQVSLRIHRESGQLWAEVEEMPGCFASGRTPEELVEALEEAIGFWISSAEHPAVVKLLVDFPLPQPRRRQEHTVPARAELVPC